MKTPFLEQKIPAYMRVGKNQCENPSSVRCASRVEEPASFTMNDTLMSEQSKTPREPCTRCRPIIHCHPPSSSDLTLGPLPSLLLHASFCSLPQVFTASSRMCNKLPYSSLPAFAFSSCDASAVGVWTWLPNDIVCQMSQFCVAVWRTNV